MNINWDAKKYDSSFSFVPDYGADVLSLIETRQGIAVDLGCGSGALTGRLAEKGFKVIGVDSSERMLEQARKANEGVEFICADACSFTIEDKADVIFSNAVFHWIDDQDALLENIHEQLRPNGELVFEFGGKDCAETVHAELERQFAAHGLLYPRVFYFPTIGEYAPLLERHGFRVCYALLFDRPTRLAEGSDVIDWINMFIKKPFEGVDEALAENIKQDTREALRDKLVLDDGSWYIDYVRLRMRAVRVD